MPQAVTAPISSRVAPAVAMTSPHAMPFATVAAALATDCRHGLGAADAARRLRAHGPNAMPAGPERSRLRTFLDQFASPLILVLAVAAGLAAALGEVVEASVIAAIVVLNAVVGFVQERRAADALRALRQLAAPTARVIRDGLPAVVPASDVVPGDLVTLEAGDHVPADLRLVRASALRVNEAALSGESEPVDKDPDATPPAAAPLAERRTVCHAGTVVVAGVADGVVVATGAGTEIGRIAELVRHTPEGETPLQARLRVFGRWLVAGTGALVGLLLALGLARGLPIVEMLLTAVSLGVAAVPEGLPAVVTVALALGVARMARRRAIVRRLASVETLGCTTVIAADKTGTLTVGTMAPRVLRTAAGDHVFDGAAAPAGPATRALWAAVAASTARLIVRGPSVDGFGDPTEIALLRAALLADVDANAVEAREPVVRLVPFDPVRKRMAVVRRTAGGDVAYVKGAAESVVPRCTRVAASGGDAALDSEGRARWLAENEALAGDGLRVLAIAERSDAESGDPEDGLTLLGLIGMHDPPRPEARAAVEACRAAGIQPVMITGDNPRTALAVARAVGIADADAQVCRGADLDAWDDATLAARVRDVAVYARVSPEHKLRIVRAWQARGAVVAMTGDGVNDAPALKGADIGVAMGLTGTDVAKQAAAMVITDDNFATIVGAVEQGRAIFENIRKTLLYLLSGNVAEILVMGVAVLLGWPLPLLPVQLLWVNLVTDGLPALALATDPPERDLLARPPRAPGTEIADRRFVAWLLASGVLMAAVTLAGFLWGWAGEGSIERARGYAFSILVIGEVLRAFPARSQSRAIWQVGLLSNGRLAAIAAASIGLQLTSHHVGWLGDLLGSGALGWGECAALAALAAVPAVLLEAWKLVGRGLASTR